MTLFKKIFGPKSPTDKEVTDFELLPNKRGGFFIGIVIYIILMI